jgi:hypothetical protein
MNSLMKTKTSLQHQRPLVGGGLLNEFDDLEVQIIDRTDALVDGLLTILAHHGASTTILGCLSKQVTQYLNTTDLETVWLSRAKHMLTYPLTKYLRNQPPESPDVEFKPTGALRGWMRQRLTCFNRKNTHLWYSWLQAKRSSLPASDNIVEATYDKHFKTLSTPDDPTLWDSLLVEEIFDDKAFLKVLNQVRRAVNKVDLSPEHMTSKSPSTSACFEQKRKDGGAASELTNLAAIDQCILHGDELVRMDLHPVIYGQSARHNVVVPVYRRSGRDDWEGLKDVSIDTSRPIKCTIQAVLEPMKVRVISKGEALPYYTMKSLQKAMHSCMRDMPCFRLIGRPFSPTDLVDLVKKADEDDEWFSIDYSAATDGLSWSYSGRIFEYIIQDLPEFVKDVARKVLGPHSLYYPDHKGDPHYRGEQRNGQLMGSVLSFPILCLANLGLYLRVNWIHQRKWTVKERLDHVLINGDDMLYCAPGHLWQVHTEMGEQVGLRMSVGKAYRHKTYANINSTCVHYPIGGKEQPFQIDFLNVGLFYGQHKVQGGTDEQDSHCLVPNIPTLLKGSLENRQCHLLGSFLKEHGEAIKEECSLIIVDSRGPRVKRYKHSRNIFLPESIGGMGIVPPPGWRYQLTEMDRRIAGVYVSRSSAPYSGPGVSPGFPLRECDTLLSSPWAIKFSDASEQVLHIGPSSTKLSRLLTRSGVQRFSYNQVSASI